MARARGRVGEAVKIGLVMYEMEVGKITKRAKVVVRADGAGNRKGRRALDKERQSNQTQI